MYTLFQLIPHFHHNNLQKGVACYYVNCKMWHLFPTRGRSGIACTHACGNTFPVHIHSSLPSLIKLTPSWAGCFERYRGSWHCASYITFLQLLFWKYSHGLMISGFLMQSRTHKKVCVTWIDSFRISYGFFFFFWLLLLFSFELFVS